MKKSTEDTLIGILSKAMKKANEKNTLVEKRQIYKDFLRNIIDYISIDEKIDIDSEEIDALITDNFINLKIEKPVIFEEEGFYPWLDDAVSNIEWRFYNRYERYLLEEKHWDPSSVISIMQISDIILNHTANPKNEHFFNKQGLVMGDIQSGKTANYTAVINKALDAGYKIIIVLAGMTKDLRNQTQTRLDKEVLGYETKTNGKGNSIGVGKFVELGVEGLTYADEEKDYGDFKRYFASHQLDNNSKPLVAIVKKHKSVLTHLYDFLNSSQNYCYTNDEERKLKVPVLIIDDEVDQASVDTKNSNSIEGASAINQAIRNILKKLARYSYIGYTATPFANVFIDPEKDHDIYPKDFILYIPSPKGYCGIKEYFGVDIKDVGDDTTDSEKDLFVEINDYEDLFTKSKSISADSSTIGLNDSLIKAIKCFIVACSIKKSRGIFEHNSMLIHIARYKKPSTTLKPKIINYVYNLYRSLDYKYDEEIGNYKQIWENEFKPVSEKRLNDLFNDNWEKIETHILPTMRSILLNICVLNGDSDDQIDYESSKVGDHIIIGGDKLSRGLTLNGLIISYYYRKSRTYDSLLQMGRWFGYRNGWLDLCRVFTSIQFMKDFITVGKVIQKFKEDLDAMFQMNLNPREVGQRILCSSNLIPTARNKMRSVIKQRISFSGELQQIISFDKKNIRKNYEMTVKFIESLGKGEVHKNHKIVFRNIPVDKVLDYLKEYKEYDDYQYGQISIAAWRKYIENLVAKGELTNWTIVLNSLANPKDGNEIKIGDYKIFKPSRTLRDGIPHEKINIYKVKTNTDPTDFKEIFKEDSEQYKKVNHYSPLQKYDEFDATKGLMSIYVTDLYDKEQDGYDYSKHKYKYKRGNIIPDGINVCAPAIWFPETKDYDESTTYYVTRDYQEVNYNDDDDFDESGDYK